MFVFCCVVKAENPTLAVSPTLATDTQSVLANDSAVATAATAPVCNGPNCKLRYKNKENIAPCAVPKTVGVCVKETGCDACCRKVTTNSRVDVDICVPPCPSKESVRSYRGGRRVVYDYGKYEAVIKSDNDGNVEVNYRKRLLGL